MRMRKVVHKKRIRIISPVRKDKVVKSRNESKKSNFMTESVNGLSAWITQKTLTLSSDTSILANSSSPRAAEYLKDWIVCGAGLWYAAQSSWPMWRRCLRTWVFPDPLRPALSSPALTPAQDNIHVRTTPPN